MIRILLLVLTAITLLGCAWDEDQLYKIKAQYPEGSWMVHKITDDTLLVNGYDPCEGTLKTLDNRMRPVNYKPSELTKLEAPPQDADDYTEDTPTEE